MYPSKIHLIVLCTSHTKRFPGDQVPITWILGALQTCKLQQVSSVSVCSCGQGKDQLTSASQEDAISKTFPIFLLLSWSFGFLEKVSDSGLGLPSLPCNHNHLRRLNIPGPFSSLNLLPSLLLPPPPPDHSTCLLSFSSLLALSCFQFGQSLSACFLKTEGIAPIAYSQHLQAHPD